MHLYENPDHADAASVLFRKIPKKLYNRIETNAMTGSSVGWGIQLVEGVNTPAVFICGCLGFIAIFLVAILWSCLRGDVQGAFGIASVLLSFHLFWCGTLYAGLE
jgi:hypothetical protein